MAHDIFLSYSERDRELADKLCCALEGQGVECWIAHRDIAAGQRWPESIVQAIKQSRLLLLLFSSESNESPQVQRELAYADSARVPMLVVRLEDVAPSEFLAYYIGSLQSIHVGPDREGNPFLDHVSKIKSRIKAPQSRNRAKKAGSNRGVAPPRNQLRTDRSPGWLEPPQQSHDDTSTTPEPLRTPASASRETFFNPYDFSSIASPQTFKGRRAELDDLVDSVRDGTHTAIFGLQRMGKTSLVEEGLEVRLRREQTLSTQVVLVRVDFQRLGERIKYGDFLREVIGRIKDALLEAGLGKSVPELRSLTNELFRNTDQADRSQLFSQFASLLRGLSDNARRRIVLFIDEFSEVRKAIELEKKTLINNPTRLRNIPTQEMYLDQTFMRHLSAMMRDRQLSERITLIVAVRPFMAEYDERESLQIFKLMKPIMLYHLDELAAKALILEPVAGFLDYQEGVVDSLYRTTAGHPYLLQFILSELVNRVRREQRKVVTREDLLRIEERMVSEGPAFDAQFSVVVSDYSIDEISMPQEKRLGLGTLALISKLGHEQREGWVREDQITDALVRHKIPKEKSASLLSQLLRARIVEERVDASCLHYRMTIPLLRKRFVRQNLYLKFFR